MARTQRGSSGRLPGASARLMVEEEDDDTVLAQGRSQWYTLNSDTLTKVSLCRVLGFFSETDYHAFLVT